MSIKERKEREREEMRDLILQAGSEIIRTEGLANLSIRKIATKIDYSPAIIYHYFHDKDDLINHLMKKSYQKIMASLASSLVSASEPTQKMQDMARSYIDMALHMPDEYMTIMLSQSPRILEHTSVLMEGASSQRPAIGLLCQGLKETYLDLDDNLIELTAQAIWTATFGLIIRLIIEKDLISDEQKEKLIEHHLRSITEGMILGNITNITRGRIHG